MFLATEHILPKGSIVTLDFAVEYKKKISAIQARAVVRWVSSKKPPIGMGLEFIEFQGLGNRAFTDWAQSLFEKAEKSGATAVGVDTDGAGSYAMRTNNKPVFRKTSEDITDLVNSTSLPVIIKGVMCVEDAVEAVDAGAKAIVVSNHGGRVLDHTPGTADVLPEIADALHGRSAMIVVDGGVRTGYDVLKMLALGADAVLIGRDIVRAAVGAGSEGVRLQMEFLQKTLAKAMLMTGCVSLTKISRNILDKA